MYLFGHMNVPACAPVLTRKELGDPDPFTMRYREEITKIVENIVRNCMDKTTAIAAIRAYAKSVISDDRQPRFIEVVEKDLMGLHAGNIACHRLQMDEYERWQCSWH